jgi:propionyl-CoA carboxylase alpha chain
MEHQVRAPAAGRLVELRVAVGQTVEQGAVLAVVDELVDELADSEGEPDE